MLCSAACRDREDSRAAKGKALVEGMEGNRATEDTIRIWEAVVVAEEDLGVAEGEGADGRMTTQTPLSRKRGVGDKTVLMIYATQSGHRLADIRPMIVMELRSNCRRKVQFIRTMGLNLPAKSTTTQSSTEPRSKRNPRIIPTAQV